MSKTGTATSPPREGEPVETAINIEVNQSTRDQSKSAKILTVTGRLFMEMTSLCSSDLNSALSVLSTIYLFMKVSLSPDIILCG